MKKIVLIIILFIFSSFAQTNIKDWGENFLKNPKGYFQSTYELGIFQKLKSKFSNIKLTDISDLENQRNIEFSIDGKMIIYQLILEIDEQNKIRFAYRNPKSLNLNKSNFSNENTIKWIGKFFYHIDAGDTSLIKDMIFQKDVEIIYNQSRDKSKIISKLINDFPKIIQPTKTNVKENDESVSIQMIIDLYADLYIRIPKKLIYPLDTDYLQEKLFNRIIFNLNNSNYTFGYETTLNIEELKQLFKNKYKDALIKDNIITIPYENRRFKKLDKIEYNLPASIFSNTIDVKEINPQLKLFYNKDESTILMNEKYSISFYGQKKIGRKNIERIQQILQEIYVQILSINEEAKFANFKSVKGWARFRGLLVKEIQLFDWIKWNIFWSSLWDEGELFYYPSSVDYTNEKIAIKGIVYIFPESESFFYHFGELTIIYPEDNHEKPVEIQLVFYPYNRDEASSFFEE